MSLIEKWKLRKIKKLRALSNSEKSIEKYLKDDKWNIRKAAIEALEFVGSESATDKLVQHFEQLCTYDYDHYFNSDGERILQALEKIDSQKSIDFIRHIYWDYKKDKTNNYSGFAQRVQSKKGNPEIILDHIIELNYEKLNNKTIKTLCNEIRKHIKKEKHLIQILTETNFPEIANEALKKINDLNKVAVPNLKRMVWNEVASKEVLTNISDPNVILQIIEDVDAENIVNEEIYLTCGACVFDLILNRLNQHGVPINTTEKQVNCRFCNGTGYFAVYEYLSEDQIYYGEKPKIVGTDSCDSCNGTGKLIHREIQIKYLDKTIFLYVTLNKDSQVLEICK